MALSLLDASLQDSGAASPDGGRPDGEPCLVALGTQLPGGSGFSLLNEGLSAPLLPRRAEGEESRAQALRKRAEFIRPSIRPESRLGLHQCFKICEQLYNKKESVSFHRWCSLAVMLPTVCILSS